MAADPTTEYDRGYWAAIEILRDEAKRLHDTPEGLRRGDAQPLLKAASFFEFLRPQPAPVDPLATAKLRLGEWLAADSQRTWWWSSHRGPHIVKLILDAWDDSRNHDYCGRGATEADAINAALDTAERLGKP